MKFILIATILVLFIALTNASCPVTCGACNDSGECVRCSNDNTPSSNCNCPQGQYDDGGCKPCGSLCSSCVEAEKCTGCQEAPGLALHLEKGLCMCMEDNYIENPSATTAQDRCTECFIYGNTCVAECPSGTSANSDVMICEMSKKEDVENDDQTHIIIVAVIIIVVQLLLSIALYNYLYGKLREAFTKDQNAVHELSPEERAYLQNQGDAERGNVALENNARRSRGSSSQQSEVIE